MSKEFNFVIARPWEESDPDNLCIYMYYGAEVHRGSMKSAKSYLSYANNNSKNKYSIYKVKYKKVE